MKSLLTAIVGTLLLFAVSHASDLPDVKPEIKKDCGACHISHAMGGEMALKAPVSELCAGCHPDRVSPAEHKVDIVPLMAVNGLPLDKDGRMTCITCHDPHGNGDFEKMLRVKPKTLCQRCHLK